MPSVASQLNILHSRHTNHGARSHSASAEAARTESPFAQFLDGTSEPPPPPAKGPPARAPAAVTAVAATSDDAPPDASAIDNSAPINPPPDGSAANLPSAEAAGIAPTDTQNAQAAAETAAVAAVDDDKTADNGCANAPFGAPTEPAAVIQAAAIPISPGDQAPPQPLSAETAVTAADTISTTQSSELVKNAQLTGQPAAGENPDNAPLPPVTSSVPLVTPALPDNQIASQKTAAASATPPKPVSLSQGHRAASGKPTAAPAPAAGAVADDAAPSPDAERQQRVAASSNPETANTTGELTAKPHGQTAPHLDLRVDESMATAKPGSVGATDPTPNPQPLGSVANALTPAASAAPTALPPDAAPIQIAGLAVEIAARAQAGRNRFEIRLDPPELGRIDVRLDVDASGNVTSRLVVERAETLEVLRRDAGDLQRALQDAGLKTSDNGLQFALRDQNFAGRRDGGEAAPPRARLIVPDAGSVTEIVPDYARVNRRGIDIRV